jgi:hypothetical protein
MAKTTTRKVTKVARTGGGRTTKRGQTSWFFPTIITLTVILGTFLIVFSRSQRQPDTTRPRIGADHWHAAIAFDICGTFAANVPDNGQDPLGIHTHGDGIVHIHPFSSQAAGKKATLKIWLDTVGATATATELKLPGEASAHKDGQQCDGKDATIVTKVWDSRAPTDTGHIVAGSPGDIHLKDNQLITVAFVPSGADIGRPPSEKQLDNLSDVAGATSTTTPGASSTVPGETTTSSPPTTAAEPTTTARP